MLRRLNLHLRSVFKDRLPLFPRIHEKPVSNHLQARVPIELIYRIIDLYLKEDLGALKTLTLTSRTLYLYCRRFIHATITIEARAQGSPSLIERFAELLKRNPQLADLVHVLHFWHIPHSTPPNAVRFRVSKEEKALCYVLDKLHNLKMIRLLGTPGLQWDSLHRKVQLAIIERLQQEGLNTVFMRFLSLPTHVLSACNSVQDMRLCGSLVEKESAQVRVRGRGPTQLGLCHIDRPYLPLLSSSKTWDITGIQTLLLGQIPMLDVHHLNFICAFSSSLVTLQFEPYSFYGEQVIPTLDLSMLPSLQVIKTGAQAVDIWLALDWIARTLDTRPSGFGAMKEIELSLNPCPDAVTLDHHRALWKLASQQQHSRSILKTVPIWGLSRTLVQMENGQHIIEVRCLGPYLLGGHGEAEQACH